LAESEQDSTISAMFITPDQSNHFYLVMINSGKSTFSGLADISTLALVTLFSRAIESQSDAPILRDEGAVQISSALRPALDASPDPLRRSLSRYEIKPILRLHVALRAWYYDSVARAFIQENPHGVVVNLGCGLDTRFFRIDPGQAFCFDLDLPEMIAFKRHFIQESERYRMIAQSVFEHGWMDRVAEAGERPVLFLAEGVFIYLEPDQVHTLISKLQQRFPGCELVCEVFNRRWLNWPFKSITNWSIQQISGLAGQPVYHFGIRKSEEIESWGKGIQLLGDWTYFDPDHPKLNWLRWFGKLELFRKIIWTVHYRL